MGDDHLPGVLRPNFPSFGPKHSTSLPDIKKFPPPVPSLHHSSSSSLSLQASPQLLGSPTKSPSPPPSSGWRLTFAQPAAQYLAFRQRLEANCVSLENVSISSGKEGSESVCLYGTVKVKNIAFVKHVKLRVTWDKWASQKDYPATHNAQLSNNGGTGGSGGGVRYDTFMFNFCVDFTGKPSPRELQFAVCFSIGDEGKGGEYWDNNDGCNYVVVEEGAAHPNAFFRPHLSTGPMGIPERTSMGGDSLSLSPPSSAYTLDYRPNFGGFSSLTSYSSWQHYSSESMYY